MMSAYNEGKRHGEFGGKRDANPYAKGWLRFDNGVWERAVGAVDLSVITAAEQWDKGWLAGFVSYCEEVFDKRTADCQEALDEEFGR